MENGCKARWIVTMLLGAWLSGCIAPPDYPIEPTLEYIGMNKMGYRQASGRNGVRRDSLRFFFKFTDGDGDLFTDNQNIIFYDSRDDSPSKNVFPEISQQGLNNGISGELEVIIDNGICCIYPNGDPPCLPSAFFSRDTFFYYVELRDKAGHVSNRVRTDPIVITCD